MAYGLAVGARPTLLFGGIILLVPVVQAWRDRQRVWVLLAAAVVPMALIGAGLMLYNELRFDSPLDFGWRYQLTWERQITRQLFSVRFLWFNFLIYFLEPARWNSHFPFVHEAAAPPVPVGYGQLPNCFGVLTNIPLVWLALAAPVAWRNRSGQTYRVLRMFVTATALLFGMCVLTLGLFCGSNPRYEVDFLPTLVLLAVIGILGVERVLADRTTWRRAAQELGKVPEAIEHYQQALRIDPDYAEAHHNLGGALLRVGKPKEAIGHFQEAVRTKPDYADAHYNLAVALEKMGRLTEAIGEYQQALRLKPDFALGHNNLGVALWHARKVSEAIGEYEEALRINPNLVEAHFNLGLELEKLGRTPEAIEHYQQALRLNPDFARARSALTRLGAGP
jgi:Tfp pilus assembly protein PilF